jgi:hypothetical protein
MNADDQQAISERDQLWASLRALQPEIERLAAGDVDDNTQRQRLLSIMLGKIVLAELKFRDRESVPEL